MKLFFTSILIFLVALNFVQGQTLNEKKYFKEFVDNPDISWVCISKLKVEIPEIEKFAIRLDENARNGTIQVNEPTSDKVLPKEKLFKMVNVPDTILTINPLNLTVEERIEKYDYILETAHLFLNELWYYDKKTNELISTINSFSTQYEVFKNDSSLGYSKLFQKLNQSSNQVFSKPITIVRLIEFDTTSLNLMPIKTTYNESLAKLIWDNLENFIVTNDVGDTLVDNSNAILSETIVTRINPFTMLKEEVIQNREYYWQQVDYFSVVEEWQIDYKNFNIKKTIKKISPVLKKGYDVNGFLRIDNFIPFTIVCD